MGGPLKIGSVTVDTIGQLKVGSSNVQQAYVGSVLVFPASTTTTTTSTTTSTTTPSPATINWYNYELPSPYVDSDLEINGTLYAGGSAQGSFSVAGNSSVLAKQLSATSTGVLGGYNLLIKNITDSTIVYDNTVTAVVSSYTIMNSNTFTATAGKTYAISASSFDATAPTTTTTTTTTTSTTSTTTTAVQTTTTTSTTTSTTTDAPTTTTTTSTTTSTTTEAPTTTTSTTTSTTTVAYYTFGLGVDPTSFSGACIEHGLGTLNYYAAVPTLANGVVLYQDNALSAVVPDNYYSDGVNSWLVTGGNGILTSQTSCTPTTTTTSTTTSTTTEAPTTTTSTTTTTTTAAPTSVTIFWNTSEVGSGGVRLVIYDSTSTPIVDEESSGAGPTNGSVTTSNTPFTVAVSRIAGTEVAQYRICNDSNSTEITHNYNVTSEVTYVVDPTPLTTTIFATYGDSNTPINCSVE